MVAISTNSFTSALAVGTYSATVTFSSGTTSITRSITLMVEQAQANCDSVTAGPYQFQVANLLSQDVLVYFGDATLPDGCPE